MSPRVQIGYGAKLEAYSTSSPFFVKLGKLNRLPATPFEEAKIAAREVYEQLGATPTLCLSGGLDSEAMALAFEAAAIPFDVTTLRFNDGLNEHEIARAREFCKARNIKQHLIDLDVVDFFENERYLKYLDKYFCHGLEIAAQLWFIEQIERPFVWGAEAFRMFLKDGNPQLQAVSEHEAVISRYVDQNKLNAIANFHFYTPELAWSFFRASLSVKSTVYPDDHCEAHYAEKLAFYTFCGFIGLDNPARTQKLHGFELAKEHFDKKLAPRNYKEVYRHPFTSRFPIRQKAFIKISHDDDIAREILRMGRSS